MQAHRKIVAALIGWLITGCALPPGFGPSESSHQIYSLDGVKLISPDYPNGNHPDTFLQPEYEISPTRRLLLRYESFSDLVNSVDIARDKKVHLEIAIADIEQKPRAAESLSLCPITRNWMMLATWHVAHNGPAARWKDGGEYDSFGCLKAEADREPTETSSTTSRVLVFDVTRWFIDYARGRSENYGLILLSDQPVRIVGDLSGSYSPRMRFNKY